MECEAGGRRRARHIVAVILLLCSLVPNSTSLSLQGLSKAVKEDKGGNEAPAIDVKTGSIGINGKELNFQSGSASAPGNELLRVDLDPSDSTEMLELEKDFSNKAEWKRLTSSLHCGLDKMKLMFTGLGAADLQLDMGNAPPLPLMQVLETCDYLMQQNELGLDLIVPYDGCNVIQENGRYVLQMRLQETPVKFACPMLPSPDSTPGSTASEPLQQPWEVSFSPGSNSRRRSKRHIGWPPICDPHYLSYYSCPYYIYVAEFSKPNTPAPPPYYPYNPYYINSPNYPYKPFPSTPLKPARPCSTTASPTTPATTPATTTKKCSRGKPAITEYPGQIRQDTSFHKLPFPVPISHFPRAGQFLENQKYMPESGFQDPVLSGFHWESVPWFPQSADQGNYQFD
ncbi:uncharacterized protein LOC111572755 [Amphiprion ocellaris]|uniref:uncharacterized protein LOC111572755 n=1 Tax=Amphiprion ocellaris TaxID=80972 RepID=UPI000C303B8E|nr:uncharacterized protein LOC111572755 [Amphiprion ocellaris]